MNLRDALLAALTQYGSPVVFGAVAVAALGTPLPISLLLIIAGSLAAQGVMQFWWIIAVASVGSILGDQIGYMIGRWGGPRLHDLLVRLSGGNERLETVTARAREWGGPGIFFTRWLVGALGPAVNLVSGITRYSWARFVLWDVLGEVFGVSMYIGLGRMFSDRVFALDAFLGDASWAVLALVAAFFLGWWLLALVKRKRGEG